MNKKEAAIAYRESLETKNLAKITKLESDVNKLRSALEALIKNGFQIPSNKDYENAVDIFTKTK